MDDVIAAAATVILLPCGELLIRKKTEKIRVVFKQKQSTVIQDWIQEYIQLSHFAYG